MGKVLEIAICKNKGEKTFNVNDIEAIAGKGLADDRNFKENNDKRIQITLIEIENINYFNKVSETNIPAKNFRRNIITKGIKLNELLNKSFFIGNIKVFAHDLCKPCKTLQDFLNQKNTIKELLHKGGLRCEILTSGKIFLDDLIKSD
tara:strand:- start:78 stop:521 length:444 start_codon:yes stop_codon:yes gene_type:complete